MARKTKIKIFSESNGSMLEKNINTWLQGQAEDSILDIQLSCNGNINKTVMIVYKN